MNKNNSIEQMKSDRNLLNYFKVGDDIEIIRMPEQWSSSCGGKCPFGAKIKFPHITKIVKIEYSSENNHTSISDGIYGWSLNVLIDSDCLYPLKIIRKQKLKKICSSQEIK